LRAEKCEFTNRRCFQRGLVWELDGITAGITENAGYKGLSSGPSKLEAGHLPVFEPWGSKFGALSNTGIYRKMKQGLRWLHGSFFAAVQARKALR